MASRHHNADEHLSRITTLWTQFFQAHQEDAEAVRTAQTQMMQRYSGAVYRYLLKLVGDSDGADDLFQQFALEFVRGGFRHASPERGRFRDYLKSSILNLVRRHRRLATRNVLDALGTASLAELPDTRDLADPDVDADLIASLREELLDRAWGGLKRFENESGKLYFTLLNFRAENPNATAEQSAEFLTLRQRSAQAYTSAATRKLLQRSREKFAEILLDELAATTGSVDRELLEGEARELGLLPYCHAGLRKRFG